MNAQALEEYLVSAYGDARWGGGGLRKAYPLRPITEKSLSVCQGHGRNQGVSSRKRTVAEVPRSGHRNDHHQGREVSQLLARKEGGHWREGGKKKKEEAGRKKNRIETIFNQSSFWLGSPQQDGDLPPNAYLWVGCSFPIL